MGFIRVSRNLLMFISVLSLTSATTTLPTTTTTLPPTTTTTQPTTTITTTQPTTTPPTTTLPALPTTPLPTTTTPPPPPTTPTPTTTPPPPPTTPPPTTTPPTTPTTPPTTTPPTTTTTPTTTPTTPTTPPPPTTTTPPPPPTTTPPTTTTTTPTTPTTSPTTTAPFTSSTTPTTSTTSTSANFYPFGSAVGDVQTLVNYGGEDSAPVNLTRPFVYFGRTYNRIYVNYNGLLSFNQPIIEDPYTFPYNGSQDLIAPLWADFDDYGIVAYYYHEYTSGNVLTRATDDIRRHYPGLSFNATWVFVATWDYVQTSDLNTFLQHSAPSNTFQAVLISDGVSSFVLMNYGDMSVINYPVEAGYDTMGSTNYFVIPGSNNGSLIPSLSSTSNVNTPGRWAFSLNRENVIGLQMKVTSFLNLTDSGNLAFVMQKLKDELVNRGMPSYVKVTARKVQKTKL